MKDKKIKIIIATIRPWNITNANKLKNRLKAKCKIFTLTDKEGLNYKKIKKNNPKFIFFPHWSWKIPSQIYANFKCILFHMTDLPFGRGGSPLQNLILKGIKRTKISAIKVAGGIDAGNIYLKRSLSLDGSAEDIYRRGSKIIFGDMIPYIIKKEPRPKPQRGRITIFKRRRPQDSKIPNKIGLVGIYDYIRMLDAPSYPHAFIETRKLCFEFNKARKIGNSVEAHVTIKKG